MMMISRLTRTAAAAAATGTTTTTTALSRALRGGRQPYSTSPVVGDRIVIAIGGNALQRRGERLTIENMLKAAADMAPTSEYCTGLACVVFVFVHVFVIVWKLYATTILSSCILSSGCFSHTITSNCIHQSLPFVKNTKSS